MSTRNKAGRRPVRRSRVANEAQTGPNTHGVVRELLNVMNKNGLTSIHVEKSTLESAIVGDVKLSADGKFSVGDPKGFSTLESKGVRRNRRRVESAGPDMDWFEDVSTGGDSEESVNEIVEYEDRDDLISIYNSRDDQFILIPKGSKYKSALSDLQDLCVSVGEAPYKSVELSLEDSAKALSSMWPLESAMELFRDHGAKSCVLFYFRD